MLNIQCGSIQADALEVLESLNAKIQKHDVYPQYVVDMDIDYTTSYDELGRAIFVLANGTRIARTGQYETIPYSLFVAPPAPDWKAILETFLDSPDFKQGCILSTKSVGGYSVELLPSGRWKLVLNATIIFDYNKNGRTIELPELDTDVITSYIGLRAGKYDQYLSDEFDREEEDLKAHMLLWSPMF